MNTNTKARFDAERVEAGYKYLDSLRELMGVGQPVGEGGMPEILPCPFQVNGGLHDIRHEHGKVQCRQHTKWIRRDVWNTRAPQPATAPGDYIAWCRYVNHGQDDDGADILTFEACSSDDKGAFRVYAAPAATPTDVAERARRLAKKIAADKSVRHLMNPASDPIMTHDRLLDRLADIIAAEFK